MPVIASTLPNVSFPRICLTAISVSDTTLIWRTTFVLLNADVAARDRRSGELTAQMNVTVSRRIRTA